MVQLNLPTFSAKIIEENGKKMIFDPIRKRMVALTPEENVRQHFVAFMINQKGYPLSHISNELSISLNDMSRRCDTVIFDKNGSPKIIIEYKAPSVSISSDVFAQISRYNLVLKVDYLIVSNGLRHFCVKMDYDNHTYSFMNDIPGYDDI